MPRGNSSLVKNPIRRSAAVTTNSTVVNQWLSKTSTRSGFNTSKTSVRSFVQSGVERALVAVVELATQVVRQHDGGDVREQSRADDFTHGWSLPLSVVS